MTGGFHRSPSDSKSLPLSRIFLSIIDALRSAVVWTVSTLFHISNSPIFFSMFLEVVPCTSTMTSITVTFIFHNVFETLWQEPDIFQFFFSLYFNSNQLNRQSLLACSFFLLYHNKVRSSDRDWVGRNSFLYQSSKRFFRSYFLEKFLLWVFIYP